MRGSSSVVGITAGCMLMDNSPTIKCVFSSKITDILSVEKSDATIKLENGKIITIKSAKIKKGDNYCLSYAKN